MAEMIHSGGNIAKRRLIITVIIAVISAIISGIFFILMSLSVPNMHVMLLLILGLSALLTVFLILWTLGATRKYQRLAKVILRCYLVCLATGVAFFLVLQGFILSGSHTDVADADCLIVLGAGLHGDVPSLILSQRLNAASAYQKTQGDIPIIVSGGMGRGETITEAEAMYRYLSSRGIDTDLIWKEEASTSTRENINFSRTLMEKNGLDTERIRVAVVSNEFHLYRARLIAEKAGLDVVGIAVETPGLFLRVLYSLREAFSLAAELLF